MKRVFLIYFSLIIYISVCYSQGEIDNQDKIFYRNERSFGLLLNSNGWGGNFSFGKRIDGFRKRLYSIDFVGIKHPKEIKVTSIINSQGHFVFGKKNSFFVIRAGYGRQKEIFRKQDKGGVSIRYFYSIGPCLGLLKPIYYEVYYPDYSTQELDDYYPVTEKFNKESIYVAIISDKSSFILGTDEISLIPGGFTKLGFCFEYSQTDELIRALEAGIIFDAFPSKINIMATTENNQFFISLFLGFRFGKVINGRLTEKN